MIHSSVVCCVLLSAAQAGQSGTIVVPDATIRYEAAGSGSPLVLIHGWAQDMSIWDGQVPAFSSRYRVIRYDRRGFGGSTGYADASADPADLAALLDSLGVRSAHLLGLSAGARTAVDFAVAFPDRVRSLIAYGQPPLPGFSPMPDGPPPVAVFRDIARIHGLDSAGRLLQAHPLAWMPPERPELQELLKAMWARYRGRDLLDPRPESGRIPAAHLDQVAGLRVPVMVEPQFYCARRRRYVPSS